MTDDYSRIAYAEICSDEKAETVIGVLQQAVAWFAKRGVRVEAHWPRPVSRVAVAEFGHDVAQGVHREFGGDLCRRRSMG